MVQHSLSQHGILGVLVNLWLVFDVLGAVSVPRHDTRDNDGGRCKAQSFVAAFSSLKERETTPSPEARVDYTVLAVQYVVLL